MDPQEIGLLALYGAILAVLPWIIKDQSKIICNDSTHIQTRLDSLPCNRGEGCSEDSP